MNVSGVKQKELDDMGIQEDKVRVRIYQIQSDRDTDGVKFMGFEETKTLQHKEAINAAIYEKVFEGELDLDEPEAVYRQLNQEGHPLFRGHSLSVSDIVVNDKAAYFCDRVGFTQIDFDESLTHKPDNLIRVVYVEPHKAPYVAEIANTLKGQQRAVKGLIEYIYNDDGTIIVINEESKINGMEGNRRITGDVICGPFFIAKDAVETLCSLTDEESSAYMTKFAVPDEDITQEEIKEHTGFSFHMW